MGASFDWIIVIEFNPEICYVQFNISTNHEQNNEIHDPHAEFITFKCLLEL